MVKYTANDIEVLEGPEGLRSNVGMYLGEASTQVLRAFREIYENSVDVYAKEMNDFVSVSLQGTKLPQTFVVIDKGPGIPVEKHKKTGVSTLTTVFTTIHAGSNFKKQERGKAKSRGKHGVGSSATCACSDTFIVWTCRDKQWYTQVFKKGKPITEVEKLKKIPQEFVDLGASKSSGTIIKFTPDYTILPKTIIKEQELFDFIRQNAELNSGLKVRFVGQKIDETIHNKRGIIALLENFIRSQKHKPNVLGEPFIFESDNLSVALQWSDLEGETVLSYVNYGETSNGGSHVQGLFDAITKEFKAVAKKGDDFTAQDLREGLIAVIHYKCNDDDYSGQNKERLNTVSAIKIVKDTVSDPLSKWITRHKKLVREISQRANQIKKAKQEAKAITKAATALKTTNKSVLITDGKLTMSNPKCPPEQRELIVVEGDSAGGSCIPERNPYNQEILKLRGKILNSARSTIAKDLANTPLVNLLVALGADEKSIKKGEQITSFRVGKIILLTDEDIDGKHIKVLLFTALEKYAPEAFKQGIVYIADVPFFQASDPKTGNKVFGKSLEEVQTLGGKNWHISRLKGLGEMNADELAPFCLYPETRKLIRIPYFNNAKEREEYLRLVGEDVQYRKQMLGVE